MLCCILVKNNLSFGYFDVGGFYFLFFGICGNWLGIVGLLFRLFFMKKVVVCSWVLKIFKLL